MSVGDLARVGAVGVLLRQANACFSELVARADLLGQVTVLIRNGRPAAVIASSYDSQARARLVGLWKLLAGVWPPGADPDGDDARVRLQAHASRVVSPVGGPLR